MALRSQALQSHAALAEIRDSLLETYASNDAMNQLILSSSTLARGAPSRPAKKAMAGQSRPSSHICTTTVWCG